MWTLFSPFSLFYFSLFSPFFFILMVFRFFLLHTKIAIHRNIPQLLIKWYSLVLAYVLRPKAKRVVHNKNSDNQGSKGLARGTITHIGKLFSNVASSTNNASFLSSFMQMQYVVSKSVRTDSREWQLWMSLSWKKKNHMTTNDEVVHLVPKPHMFTSHIYSHLLGQNQAWFTKVWT